MKLNQTEVYKAYEPLFKESLFNCWKEFLLADNVSQGDPYYARNTWEEAKRTAMQIMNSENPQNTLDNITSLNRSLLSYNDLVSFYIMIGCAVTMVRTKGIKLTCVYPENYIERWVNDIINYFEFVEMEINYDYSKADGGLTQSADNTNRETDNDECKKKIEELEETVKKQHDKISELEEQLKRINNMMIKRLKPFFNDGEEAAKNYVKEIENLSEDSYKARFSYELIKQGKLTIGERERKKFWEILHDWGLYERSYANWCATCCKKITIK